MTAMGALSWSACDAIISVPNATLSPDLTCSDGACTCAAPHGSCVATFDGTCPINFDTDALNCGRCGHSCLGGACSGGNCQPIILDSTFQPVSISLFGDQLYLANWSIGDQCQGSPFYTLPIDGGTPSPAFAATQCGFAQTVFGNDLYWADTDVWVSALAPPAPPAMLATGVAWVLAANDGNLFWSGLDSAMMYQTGIFTVSLPGGTPTMISAEQEANGLAANSLGAYWITGDDTPDAGPDAGGGIYFAPNGATTSTLLAPVPGDNIAVDDAHVFFSDSDGLKVMPVDGGKPLVLANGAYLAAGVSSGDQFYYLDANASVVSQVSVDGGPVTVLATGFASEDFASIAVDSQAVYWLADTIIAKVAR
jgi:hypothetical protein